MISPYGFEQKRIRQKNTAKRQEMQERFSKIYSYPISFTTTATIRPELIEQTYRSLRKSIPGIDFSKTTLYLNVDPLPAGKSPQNVVNIAGQFFGKVITNEPTLPNLSAAINWLWTQADTDYIFHLEDDWEFICKIDINLVMKSFVPGIEMVQFKRKNSLYQGTVGLTPCIMSRRFYKGFAGKFSLDMNPEFQMQSYFRKDTGYESMRSDNLQASSVHVYETKDFVVRDIGRKWMDKSNYIRGEHPFFISWKSK